MPRIIILLAVASALALLGIGTYFVFTAGPVAVSVGPTPTFVLATSTISESTDAFDIDAEYPQFGMSAIDTQIRTAYEEAIAELKAQPVVPHGESAAKNSFFGRFDKTYSGPDIISAELILSQYTGGAHPSTIFAGVAFDRTTGKRLELSDALALIGKNITDVSASSTQILTHDLGEGFMFPEGANTNPENFSSFVVSADMVTFIFQQYQVAPYAAGPQRVSFLRVR
ncbi:MAG: hypothetical protein RLZZ342_152 [Candidatus Parcubacteria bacterium]|jgi:hypothetical protein